MKVAVTILSSVFAMALTFAPVIADPQDLIDDGWVLDIGGIATGELADIVNDVTYAWGSDSIIQGNGAMYLGEQSRAWFRFADTPVFGEISFYVYDKGLSAEHAHSTYAGRWGVMNNPTPNPIPATGTSNDQLMVVELSWKSYMDGNVTYAFINANNSDVSTASSHFSQTWPGGYDGPSTGDHAYRRVAGATLDEPIIEESLPIGQDPVHVQGAWSKWTFSVHDGEDMTFKVTDADGVSNEQAWSVIPTLDSVFDTGFSTTGFNQVYFYGGNPNDRGTENTYGLWIDDIVFTPDPGQGVDAWFYDFENDICKQRGAYADFTCDGQVGLLDLDILGQYWMTTGHPVETSYQFGDANADGDVGLLDLDILGQNWLTSTPIPEPSVAIIMMAVLIICFILNQRQTKL